MAFGGSWQSPACGWVSPVSASSPMVSSSRSMSVSPSLLSTVSGFRAHPNLQGRHPEILYYVCQNLFESQVISTSSKRTWLLGATVQPTLGLICSAKVSFFSPGQQKWPSFSSRFLSPTCTAFWLPCWVIWDPGLQFFFCSSPTPRSSDELSHFWKCVLRN